MQKLAIILFWICIAITKLMTQCPPNLDQVFLKSQEQVDVFLKDFPDCKEIETRKGLVFQLNKEEFGTPIHDLSPLSQLTSIQGGLTISRDFADLSLPELNSLEGLHNVRELDRLIITNSKGLKNLSGLSNLDSLLDLNLEGCTRLESMGMGNIHVSEDIVLNHLPVFSNIDELSIPNNLSSLTVWNCDNLDVSGRLDNLQSVRFALTLEHHDIGFVKNITEIGRLWFSGSGPVQDLSDFTSLEKIESGVTLIELNELENLDLFKSVEIVGNFAGITLRSLPKLSEISGFDHITSLTGLFVKGCNSLESLSGFNSLTNITLTLDISENEKLINVDGLDNLKEVGNAVLVYRNPSLLEIDAFSNLEILGGLGGHSTTVPSGTLVISENATLESIIGLRNVFSNNPERITIDDNPNLSVCHIQMVCQYLHNYKSAIGENGIGCNSNNEVRNQCFDPVIEKIFFDQNNSSLDENEYAIPIGESLYNSDYRLFPDNNGIIKFAPFEGEIDLKYQAPQFWLPTTETVYNFPNSDGLDTVRTGIIAIDQFDDLEVYLLFSPIICDRQYDLKLVFKNRGTTILNVISKLIAVGEYKASFPEPTSIDLPDIYNEANALLPGQVKEVEFKFLSPSVDDLPLGETVFQELSYDAYDESGEFLFSEEKSYPIEFLCAYDPNDKQVYPAGVQEENYTLFEENRLQYLIRFQNTGNFHAEDIVIKDTLDNNLDWSTFQFVGASHDISEIRMEENALSFVFENIFLPDSVNNELESHGFVSYSIQTNGGLDENTRIENTAHIYFDSNPAIVTNTVFNTMVSEIPGGTSTSDGPRTTFAIFPNPADEFIQVRGIETAQSHRFSIYNSKGQVVKNGILDKNKTISISDLTPSLYLLRLGEGVEKFLVE